MKSIFLIEAPFQLLSAYEAISAYNIIEYKIYIRLSSRKSNDFQLKRLVAMLFGNTENIEYFHIKSRSRSLLDLFKIFCIGLYFFLYSKKYKYVFVGNFDSKVLKLIVKVVNIQKIILLDDGIKNILLQSSFTDSCNYNMFTMLSSLEPYNSQVIIYNYFNNFKKKIYNIKIENINDLLFIGADLSESGIMEEGDYIKYIDKISKINSGKLIYIPHRSEYKCKLDKISKLTNVKVEKLDYPVEFYIYYKKIRPYKILSFYSAALISLKYLYENIEIVALKFDYRNVENSKDIDLVYLYLSKHIKVDAIEI